MITDGMRTSEFWITGILPFVIVILNHVLGLGLSVGELAAGAFGTTGYGVSRGLAK